MNYIRGEIQIEEQYRNALNKFQRQKMELPSKIFSQVAHNKRPKSEEQMLIVMDKSTHEEHLFQPLQTKNKQFKLAVTFLTGYNGIFNVTNSNYKINFLKSVSVEDRYIQRTIPPSVHEIEPLNKVMKRIIIDEGHFSQVSYPFTIKPNFSTLESILERST